MADAGLRADTPTLRRECGDHEPAPISNEAGRRDEAILRDPARNKDVAFTHEERRQLGLAGLLPNAVQTIAQQATTELDQFIWVPDYANLR